MTTPNVSVVPVAEIKARRRWMAFILALFAGQGVLWTFALTVVAKDPSHAVVSDYDTRALAWDDEVRSRRDSVALGWNVAVAMESLAEGGSDLVVRLEAANAQPIVDAQIEAVMFHQARAAERSHVSLVGDATGRYAARVPVSRAGKWRVELRARRDEDVFSTAHIVHVPEKGVR